MQQRGIEAHVYEAADQVRPVGKDIWLPTNAMLIMERLGLVEELVAHGIELERIEVHDKTAGRLQAINLEKVKQQFGRTTTSILRADLQGTLAAQVAAGTFNPKHAKLRHFLGGLAKWRTKPLLIVRQLRNIAFKMMPARMNQHQVKQLYRLNF